LILEAITLFSNFISQSLLNDGDLNLIHERVVGLTFVWENIKALHWLWCLLELIANLCFSFFR